MRFYPGVSLNSDLDPVRQILTPNNEITLADALEKVLRTAKKPVHYKNLMETVVRRGLYRTKSKSLLPTVAITLRRDGRFKKVEPGIWALRK